MRSWFERVAKLWRKSDCAYCFAPVDQDCRLTCPSRECGHCGGTRRVLDYAEKLGFDEDGNPIYAGRPCPACVVS